MTYFGTREWPIWAVTTAGSFEPALGSFVGLWSEELEKALEETLNMERWGRVSPRAYVFAQEDGRHAGHFLASCLTSIHLRCSGGLQIYKDTHNKLVDISTIPQYGHKERLPESLPQRSKLV